MHWAHSEIIYLYDGTFDGFLSCVFESFKRKEMPVDILSEKLLQPSLLEQYKIDTDLSKSERVKRAIKEQIGFEAYDLVRDAMFTCLEGKEKLTLNFLKLGFEMGHKAVKLLDNDIVDKLTKAILYLHREAMFFKEFIRFSDHNGLLIAKIKPNNFVLPFIAPHFSDRFPNEKFAIYDESNSALCMYANNKCVISEVQDLQMPKPDEIELAYRKLWKMFYENAAVEGRENHKCRLNHMPKRYWSNLTEFQ